MQSFSQLKAQFLPIGGNPTDPGGGGSDTGGGGITFGGGGFAPIGNPPDGGGGGGGGFGPIVFGTPGFGSGGGGSTGTGQPGTSTTPASWLSSILSYPACVINNLLLRIAFFILGIVCIIGAIYLYKGTNPILQLPQRALRTGRKALTAAAME